MPLYRYNSETQETTSEDMVAASDYDALAARLAEAERVICDVFNEATQHPCNGLLIQGVIIPYQSKWFDLQGTADNGIVAPIVSPNETIRRDLNAELHEGFDALAASRQADSGSEPHCTHHRAFEYDCLDCSDVLERQRRSATDAPSPKRGGNR